MPPPSSTIGSPLSGRVGSTRGSRVMRGDRVGRPARPCASCRTSPSALNAQLSSTTRAGRIDARRSAPSRAARRDRWARGAAARGRRARRGFEDGARASRDRLGVAEDLDRLVVGEHARDLGVDPRNRPELARPVRLVMRPRDPGRAVRLPLGGHPPAARCRSVGGHAPRYRLEDRPVGVDAAIAQERPVAAHALDQRRIAPRDEHLFVVAGLGDVAAERIGDERVAEEREAVGARLVLVADAVGRRDVDAVGDRVRALDRPPRVDLRLAPFVLLGRVPADRRRVEEHLRAEQRRDARGLRVPLIPADQDADRGVARLPHLEAGPRARSPLVVEVPVAGREVVLLVEQRIVRDVHLAIHAEQRCRRRR